MVWMALAASAASSVLGGVLQNKAAAKQTKAANKAALQQNKLNWLETERGLLALEAQRASLRDQTSKSLQLAVRSANQSRGSLSADIGAAGMHGATVDQIMSDVNTDLRERQYEIDDQFNKGLADIDTQGLQMIGAAQAGNVQMQRTQKQSLGAMLGPALLNMADVYAQSYYSFGAKSNTRVPTSAPLTTSMGRSGYGIQVPADFRYRS